MEEQTYDWSGKRILIVEDDHANFIYVSETLKIFQPLISRCNSGLDAFFCCMAHPFPDLVIMDIKLPELNGYDSTRLIKKYHPDIPVVVLSACAMAHEKQRGIRSGCDCYITKPIMPDELISVVNKHLFPKTRVPSSNPDLFSF